MAEDSVVHVVESLDSLTGARPMLVSQLPEGNYVGAACNGPVEEPIERARYLAAPHNVIGARVGGLNNGERLYVALHTGGNR